MSEDPKQIRKQADAAWERGDRDEADRLHDKARKIEERKKMAKAQTGEFLEIRKDEAAADAARRVAVDAIYHARDQGKNMHDAGEAAAEAVLRIVGMASNFDVQRGHIFVPTHWDSAGGEWAFRCSCGMWARGPDRENICGLESAHIEAAREL